MIVKSSVVDLVKKLELTFKSESSKPLKWSSFEFLLKVKISSYGSEKIILDSLFLEQSQMLIKKIYQLKCIIESESFAEQIVSFFIELRGEPPNVKKNVLDLQRRWWVGEQELFFGFSTCALKNNLNNWRYPLEEEEILRIRDEETPTDLAEWYERMIRGSYSFQDQLDYFLKKIQILPRNLISHELFEIYYELQDDYNFKRQQLRTISESNRIYRVFCSCIHAMLTLVAFIEPHIINFGTLFDTLFDLRRHWDPNLALFSLKLFGCLKNIFKAFMESFFSTMNVAGFQNYISFNMVKDIGYLKGASFKGVSSNNFLLPLFPKFLGGDELAHRCANARHYGLLFLKSFQFAFPENITKQTIIHACQAIESAIFPKANLKFVQEMNLLQEILLNQNYENWEHCLNTFTFFSDSRVIIDCKSLLHGLSKEEETLRSNYLFYSFVYNLRNYLSQQIIILFSGFERPPSKRFLDLKKLELSIVNGLRDCTFLDNDNFQASLDNAILHARESHFEGFRKSIRFFSRCLEFSANGRHLNHCLNLSSGL